MYKISCFILWGDTINMYTKFVMCEDYSKPKKIKHTPFGVIELRPTIPIYYGVVLWCNESKVKRGKCNKIGISKKGKWRYQI